MPDTPTSRGYPRYLNTDAPNGPTQMKAIADAIDADVNGVASVVNDLYRQGLLSAIGAAGTAGRLYYATDAKILFRDSGSAWEIVSHLSAGKSIIPGSDSRTNTAYGTLPTPDRVPNIVLPTDGLIVVTYQAMWQESVANAARAAIFIGANQAKIQDTNSGAPAAQAAATAAAAVAARDRPLFTHGAGLASGAANASFTADVTTGQIVGGANDAVQEVAGAVATQTTNLGGACILFAAAGTYDISVQFKASSGSVSAKDRKLSVWTF